ncbi:dicarboxylate/amino acid:cation symporter [Brevibacterium sp. Marseille-P9724]|uniref:dicarboxylate/amino acid:cation symporter n=1 Tax=Brevibacterium sp. Marseille-P9724 TaxID=2614125 RepID=UPI00125FCC4A|nr:dicarboxylate/amino acid:cation symporter [Brevibacterium sp. Marseille-P9724]
MKLSRSLPLLVWIVIAIVLGILTGPILPEWLGGIFATYNSVFSGLLAFVVPLIIFGLVAPAIAELGKGGGKQLGLTAGIAYTSTFIAGLLAYFTASWLFRSSLEGTDIKGIAEAEGDGFEPYFTVVSAPTEVDAADPTAAAEVATEIVLEPVIGVMSALVLAIIIGSGLTGFRSRVLYRGAIEFRSIVESLIRNVIVPALPLFIFGIFADLSHSGAAIIVVQKFLLVVIVSFALTVLMLLIQYTAAGAIAGRNPLKSLWNMRDAYFTALGTASSAATIPVTLRSAKKNGVSDTVSGFVVPLCATVHLSGSMIKITCFSMAVLMITGGDTAFLTYLPFILMLGVMMIAAPGVPGGAIAAAAGLLTQMLGFGQMEVGLMFAAYIALDSFGTAANVTGDGAIAMIVDKIGGRRAEGSGQDENDRIIETS